MKRTNKIAIATLAALMAAGPIGANAASAQQYRGNSGYEHNDRYDRSDRRDNRGDDRRDDSRDARWDQRQHNGFYLANSFYRGEPTRAQQARRDYRPAYQQWRRGDRAPTSYRAHYRNVDWRRERLREPPRGYQYVRTDRGETLLVGIATGVILGLILSNN